MARGIGVTKVYFYFKDIIFFVICNYFENPHVQIFWQVGHIVPHWYRIRVHFLYNHGVVLIETCSNEQYVCINIALMRMQRWEV